jgi:prepilin-type N-terminal cleavage/methylation domain-containing protein
MQRACGFTLIEALISLLVLSIGLLGLAQLQARLSVASSQLHASTQAWLLAGSGIERLLAADLDDPAVAQETSAVVTTPATLFATRTRLAAAGPHLDAEVQVQWEHTAGAETVRLHTLTSAGAEVEHTRLLLASGR